MLEFDLDFDFGDFLSESWTVAGVFDEEHCPVFHCDVYFAFVCEGHDHVEVLEVVLQVVECLVVDVDEVSHQSEQNRQLPEFHLKRNQLEQFVSLLLGD